MKAKVIQFEPTVFTLQRKIHRECQEYEREYAKRMKYVMPWEPEPCETAEDWESFLNGDYEL